MKFRQLQIYILETIIVLIVGSLCAQAHTPKKYFCLFFKRNSQHLNFDCKYALKQVGEDLRKYPDMAILIYGRRAANEKKGLDYLRAKAARKYLMQDSTKPALKSQQVRILADGVSRDRIQLIMYLMPNTVNFKFSTITRP